MERTVRKQPEAPFLTAMGRLLLLVVGGATAVIFFAMVLLGQLMPPIMLGVLILANLLIVVQAYGLMGVIAYRLTKDALTIRTLTGLRKIPYGEIQDVKVVEFNTVQRPRTAIDMAGYHVGTYTLPELGKVRVASSRCLGEAVMLTTEQGLPLLITPEDPSAVAAELRVRMRRAAD